MMLMTKEIEKKLPKLYSQDGKDPKEVKVAVKFFAPWSGATWYVTEGEKQPDGDWLFFGFVEMQKGSPDAELGYFSLNELQSVKGPWGLAIERDRNFESTLAEVKGN